MSIQQVQGMLFGLALGDALGWPVEFLRLPEIKARFGPEGILEPPDPAFYTDDTQMTIALAEGLIAASEGSVEAIMQAVGRKFVQWLHSPDNTRAPGNACIHGIVNYERGAAWREAGDPESKGCGSAMRVAAVGYLYQDNLARLSEVAQATSLITHRHPAAIAASLAAAYLVKLALDGESPAAYLTRVHTLTADLSDELDQALRRVGHVIGWGDEIAAMRHIGEGWTGEEAVALALYCVMRHPDDYVAAVRRSANNNGDSDSIACIAGGIMGARLGIEAIPAAWQARCENRTALLLLAERLVAKRATLEDWA